MRVGARLLDQCFGNYWPNGQSWDSRTGLLKGFTRRKSVTKLCGTATSAFAVSGAHLHAARGTSVHARRIDRKTSRQFRHLFAHTLFHGAVTDVLENISAPIAHLLHLRFAQAPRGYRRAAQV